MDQYHKKAAELDCKDTLAKFTDEFVNDDNMIYLDGNSLGKLPKRSQKLSSDLIRKQWGDRLIRSWNEHWIDLPQTIAAKIAKIVGAREDEIFVGDSTSLNLYKLVFAALKAKHGKTKIISDSLNFPTDIYVLKGMIERHFENHKLELLKSSDGISIDKQSIRELLDENTALISLSYVTYKSSFMYDMRYVNDLAHQNNSFVIWDLSHAAGAVPVHLNETDADMAVGCTYKYLNGGPGSPAFLYVKKDLQEKLLNPIWSWFSHEKPFDFDLNYLSNQGIQKFAIGTPPVLSMAAIEPGLDLLIEAGMENLRDKSLLMSNFLIELIQKELEPFGFEIASPLEENRRGSHISIQHEEGYRINRALIEPMDESKIIIPDFRPPNNIRLGIAPLYNSFTDLYECILRIKTIVETKEYDRFSKERLTVT